MKGQIFTIDLLLALALMVLALGLTTQAWDHHLQQSSASFEHAKMQQIAIDAAAIEYYHGSNDNGEWLGLNNSLSQVGYTLQSDHDGVDCIGSIRGTQENPVGVFVCRKA